MKINQILSERISLGHLLPLLKNFIIDIFQKETTREEYGYDRVQLGTLAPDLRPLGLVDLENMLRKNNFTQFLQGIVKNNLNVNNKFRVIFGRDNFRQGSGLQIEKLHGEIVYTLILDYMDMEPLITSYRTSEVLGKMYRIEDTWVDEAESFKLSKERAIELIKLKDNIIATELPKTDGFKKFCSVIIHELAHLVTEQSAFSNYSKNKEKYALKDKPPPHLVSQLSKQHKLNYKNGKGLDSHFSNPAELDSYAQEIASKIRYAVEHNEEMPVRYIRKQLSNLIQTYRREVAFNKHRLTPAQQKYVYKLYKRVYQEIADILEGAKK